jgi:thiopeptide-type bacteriocin biosynthesis protein
LREAGLVGRVTLDTYYPETGRYGGPSAMPFAEKVFAADSHAVIASLQAARRDGTDRMTLAAQGMIHIACGLLGPRGALDWFAAGPVRADLPPDPAAVARIVALGRDGFLFQPSASASAADGLSLALAAYRQVLPAGADTTAILRSLLHMHHNRLIGIDPAAERTCRYLAWRGCVTAQARGAGGSGP